MNDLDGSFILPELLGRHLAFCRSWLFDYTHSYYSAQGELCHAGTVIGCGRGVGLRLGGEWSWFADSPLLKVLP